MPGENSSNLMEAYKLLCSSYHAIDDFRAKLLGFLPLATGTGLFFLINKLNAPATDTVLAAKLTIPVGTESLFVASGVFGVFITLGLFAFELNGIKNCGALIEAGKEMEKLLGITGQFSNLPRAVKAVVVNEPFAAGVIYSAVLASWSFFALHFAWCKGNPVIPLCIFLIGFTGTLSFDFFYDKPRRNI